MQSPLRYSLHSLIWLALAAVALGGSAWAADPPAGAERPAASKKSPDKRTLDDELLEDLGIADPLADLGGDQPSTDQPSTDQPASEKRDRPAAAPTDGDGEQRPAGGIDDELLRGLGEGEDVTFGPAKNPLARLNERMREVQRRIAEAKSGGETQRLEQEIAAELAQLIQQTEQACRACQKSGGPPSSSAKQPGGQAAKPAETPSEPTEQPASDSSARLRKEKTAPVDPARNQQLLKDVWGHLPAHLRQQMEQSANEEFLPKYSLEIADYYRALVERRREP
jgi:hypothetical protein